MTLSAAFTVEGASNPARHQVTYASTVDLALTSVSGATSIVWEVMACSDVIEPLPTITQSGSPTGATASFVMPTDSGDTLGRTFLVRCTVSNQVRGADGQYQSAVEYAVIGAVNSQGRLPIVPGEENYRNGTHGWAPEINEILNGAGGGGGGGGGGWTDDGAIVRLTSATDSVAIGTASLSGTEKLRVIGNSRFEQPASTSGTPKAFYVSGAGHTGLQASAEIVDVDFALDRTVQHNTGAVTTQRAFVVRAPTYGFVAASVITDAATFAISAAPIAGTNATITNAYALWVQAGNVRIGSLGAGVVQSSATGLLSSGTLQIVNGGTGLTSAGGVADRVMLTTNGTTLSMAQVTLASVVNLAGLSILGRASNSSGVMAAITGTASQVLQVNAAGTALAFGALDLSTASVSGALALGSIAQGSAAIGQALIWSGSAWAPSTSFAAQNLTTTGDILLGASPASAGSLRVKHLFTLKGRNFAAAGDASIINWGGVANDTLSLGDSAYATTIDGLSALTLASGGSTRMTIGATVSIYSNTLSFKNTAVTPLIQQETDATATVTGDLFTVQAQDCSGTTTVTAGAMALRAGDATGGSGSRTGGGLTLRSGTGATADGDVIIQRGATTVANWVGSASSFIALGAIPPSTGAVRLANNMAIYSRTTTSSDVQLLVLNGGDGVILGNSTTSLVIAGPAGLSSIRFFTAGADVFRVGSSITMFTSTFTWDPSQATPVISHTVDPAATTTGDLFTISAQDCSGTTAVTAGAMTLRAGDATGGSGSRTGGALTLRVGTGATAPGALALYGGNGATGVQIFGRNSGNNGDQILLSWDATTPRISIGNNGSPTGHIYLQTGAVQLRVGTDYVAQVTTTTLNINSGNSITFNAGSAGLMQVLDSNGSGATAGAMTVRSGDATNGAGGGTGGAALYRAGDATGGAGTRTGGALTMRSGTGATAAGTVQILGGGTSIFDWGVTAVGNLHVGSTTGATVIDATSSGVGMSIRLGGNDRVTWSNTQQTWYHSNVLFTFGQATPVFGQEITSTNTVTGQLFTINAQDCSGTTAVTGGAITVRAGDATGGSGTRTGGAVILRSGTGATADGNVTIQRGSSIGIQIVKPSSGLVIGLARTSAVTSTQMPANTGDGVVYLGDAATAPTAAPVSGLTMYSTSSGELVTVSTDNTTLCMKLGDGSNGVEIKSGGPTDDMIRFITTTGGSQNLVQLATGYLNFDASSIAAGSVVDFRYRGNTYFTMSRSGGVALSFFGAVANTQSADPVALTAASGSAGNTISDVGVSFNQTKLNDNFKSLATKYNALRTLLRSYGLAA